MISWWVIKIVPLCNSLIHGPTTLSPIDLIIFVIRGRSLGVQNISKSKSNVPDSWAEMGGHKNRTSLQTP